MDYLYFYVRTWVCHTDKKKSNMGKRVIDVKILNSNNTQSFMSMYKFSCKSEDTYTKNRLPNFKALSLVRTKPKSFETDITKNWKNEREREKKDTPMEQQIIILGKLCILSNIFKWSKTWKNRCFWIKICLHHKIIKNYKFGQYFTAVSGLKL